MAITQIWNKYKQTIKHIWVAFQLLYDSVFLKQTYFRLGKYYHILYIFKKVIVFVMHAGATGPRGDHVNLPN